MRINVLGLAAMLFTVASVEAQDTTRMQRDIDALSSPPVAGEIQALGADNPNAYVLFLQDYLASAGVYAGPLNGQLTNATIRAIVGFCREAGFAETCIRGPLLPESIGLVSEAVALALAPPSAPAEAAAGPAEEPIAVAQVADETPEEPETAEPPSLPEGWRLNDNGSRGPLGVEAELLSAGPAEAVIRFSGTVPERGYFNIDLGPAEPAGPGSWVTSVEGSAIHAPGTGGRVLLRTARLSDDAYLGELFDGVQLGAATGIVSASGVAGDEVKRLLPLVQLWAEAGEVIDVTVTLRNPTFGKQ
jgi:hypothetical protein